MSKVIAPFQIKGAIEDVNFVVTTDANNYERSKGNTIVTVNWDFENNSFRICYSSELILDKEAEKQAITIGTEKPSGNELHLTFLFIGFLKQDLKKTNSLTSKTQQR